MTNVIGNYGLWNTGSWNWGNNNTGNFNVGGGNAGDANNGRYNTGNGNDGWCNSGYYNLGNNHTGVFNTGNVEYIKMFNKQSNWTMKDFLNSDAYRILESLPLTRWVDAARMSFREKKENPSYKKNDGYLRVYTYHEAWINLWNSLNSEDKSTIQQLPNFDRDIFEEITGLQLDSINYKTELSKLHNEYLVQLKELSEKYNKTPE